MELRSEGGGGHTRCCTMLYVRRQHDAAHPTRGGKKKREGGAQPIRLRWDYEIREIIKTDLDQKGTFEYIFPPIFLIAGGLRRLDRMGRCVLWSRLRARHTLILIRWWGLQSAAATLRKIPPSYFASSPRGEKQKTKEYITTHTQTHDNNIHLLPCVQFCGRNRVGSSFGRVSRAWETQHTGRNGHKCATTHKIENGGETVFLFLSPLFEDECRGYHVVVNDDDRACNWMYLQAEHPPTACLA